MEKYKKGDIVKAKIVAVYKYGAFAVIDNEYSGLIHISEITDDFVRDVADYFSVNDIVNVKILDISTEKNQLKLSCKGALNDFHVSNRKKIKETVFGFYLLKSALPGWIDEKIKEIGKKS